MNVKNRIPFPPPTKPPVLIAFVLVLIPILIYLPVGGFGFFYYDDPAYVAENPAVRNGLTFGGIAWAFTTGHAYNWHPLTWISHMADVQLYGLNPGAHHLTNLIFHALNTLLLFIVFKKMTGAVWPSAFAAALFAAHPLQVESVAWIAERKNVLSTFFWLLTLLAYHEYVQQPGSRRYIPVLLFFILGLMAKPMVVTLPFVLLLLDYWPLQRFSLNKHMPVKHYQHMRLIWEKAPLFVLSAIASIITVLVQKEGGAIRSLQQFPLSARIANALSAYFMYVGKLIWPDPLAFLYPYPDQIPLWRSIGAALLLLSFCVLAVKLADRHPYLAVGWFWYLGTLVPVIGLIQVGVQAMADRYIYIPSIGLFMAISWAVSTFSDGRRYRSAVMAAAGLGILACLAGRSLIQIDYWRESEAYFRHTLSVTDNNYVIHLSLADVLAEQGRLDDAVAHFSSALRIKPDLAEAHNNLGVALGRKKDFFAAIKHYQEAIRLSPKYSKAESNLATAFLQLGQTGEAIKHYARSLAYDSGNAEVHNSLGLALLRTGRIDRAVHHFRQAVGLDPTGSTGRQNLNLAVSLKQKIDDRLDELAGTLQENPERVDINKHILRIENKKEALDDVIGQYVKALTLQPGFKPAEFNSVNYERAADILKKYDRKLSLYKNK